MDTKLQVGREDLPKGTRASVLFPHPRSFAHALFCDRRAPPPPPRPQVVRFPYAYYGNEDSGNMRGFTRSRLRRGTVRA